MTGDVFALIASLGSIVLTMILLARCYQAKIDEANAEASFWRRKAEQLDKPGA